MSEPLQDVWARLETARPTGDRLVARFFAPDVTDRLLCAADSQGQRHLLIAIDPDESELNDVQSRGLVVETRELLVHGSPPARYLDFECRDPAGHAAFDLIGSELAHELSGTTPHPGNIARRVLAKWRRFWGQVPRALLSREEQLALFGELWFLSVWLTTAVSIFESVSRWRGPFGSRHDFEWPSKSVEVKATTSTRGRIHRINGIDQLLPPENGVLLLFSIRLREEGGATNSLPRLIGRIRENLFADADALSRFETALVQAGYSPMHDDEYNKMLLRVIDERLFVIAGDFPRIVPGSFGGALPLGVERIEYEVNLNTYDHHCVAYAPANIANHLD